MDNTSALELALHFACHSPSESTPMVYSYCIECIDFTDREIFFKSIIEQPILMSIYKMAMKYYFTKARHWLDMSMLYNVKRLNTRLLVTLMLLLFYFHGLNNTRYIRTVLIINIPKAFHTNGLGRSPFTDVV